MRPAWYPWYPTLYRADTAHLTLAEDGAYRRLIDHYMESGRPLPDDDPALARIIGIALDEWLAIAARVRMFFRKHGNHLRQRHCDREISIMSATNKKRKSHAKHAASMRWAQAGHNEKMPPDQTRPNKKEKEERVTASQAPPLTNGATHDDQSRQRSQGSRLPTDWEPSAEDRAFAARCGLDPAVVAAGYRDYWIGKPGIAGRKVDWPATWRNWCRREARQPGAARRSKPMGTVAVVSQMLAEDDDQNPLH